MKKETLPKKGDKIYVGSSYYLSHGVDDFEGGLATIESVDIDEKLDDSNPNKVFVSIKERPDTSYNWKYLQEQQTELAKTYAGKIAHPDPDYRVSANTWE